MAPYDPDDRLSHPLDYRIAQMGGVVMYWQQSVLNTTVSWLNDRGYRIARMDASSWSNQTDVHRVIASTLDFPEYYGKNLDALSDCLYDVAGAGYGWSPEDTGLAVVIDRFDVVVGWDATFAHALLDVFAGAISVAALIGNRIMFLVQSDDNRLQFDQRIGGACVGWNDYEWAHKRRGL